MFGELPHLFDRNFAMSFFLPTVIFVWIFAVIAESFGLGPNLSITLQDDPIIGTTILGLITWLFSIFLLVANLGLYRFLEGYGNWNPLKMLLKLQQKKYSTLKKRIETLDNIYQEQKENFPRQLIDERNKLMRELTEKFPDREDLLLPTSFGNIVRAFEVYPRVMYGIESIAIWSRLLAVVPKEYRDLIDNTKAQVDFWVNIGFLSFLLVFEYATLVLITGMLPSWWILILIGVLILRSPYFAQNSAIDWGDHVKAAFDVFAPKLRDTLDISKPSTRDVEYRQWKSISQAIVYHLPDSLPPLKKSAAKGKDIKRSDKLRN